MTTMIPATPAPGSTPQPDATPATSTPVSHATTMRTPRTRTSWLVWLLMFVLFLMSSAGLAGIVYVWMQSTNTITLQQQQNDVLEKQLADMQKQFTETRESDGRFRQQTIHVLTENSEKLRSLDRIDTSYWRLAEAEFLLKQAHQRLFITRDADTADLLLASADAAVMQQKDPGLLPVRSAIATDRAALRKVPRVDHDGLYLQLQALSSQVGLLASANRFLQEESDVTTDETATYRDKLLQRLMGIVRIRHHDHPVEPLLPPEQEVYLRQNLQLALVQAQLGLLQNQQQTYITNLERADAWVRQYCQTEDPVVQNWLDELHGLMRINIAPELPDISGSLRTVEKIIEKRAEEIQRSLMLEGDEHADDDDGASTTPLSPAEAPTAPAGTTDTGSAVADPANAMPVPDAPPAPADTPADTPPATADNSEAQP